MGSCVFSDPMVHEVLKLHNVASWGENRKGGGIAWFVMIPKGKTGSCLGLLDKHVGFTAVESIHQKGDAQVVVIDFEKLSNAKGGLRDRDGENDFR